MLSRTDTTKVTRLFDQMNKAVTSLPEAALKQFVKNTPVDSGRARRSTHLELKTKIVADYPYSQRLDEGYSKQAPGGMTVPTQAWIQQEVDRRLKGL